MDSTFLNLETLDEMASFVGKGEDVAKITELAMQAKFITTLRVSQPASNCSQAPTPLSWIV